MAGRHLKAIKNTIFVALILMVPLGFLLYVSSSSVNANASFKPYRVRAFYFSTNNEAGFSLSNLRGRVTILAIVPRQVERIELDSILHLVGGWFAKQSKGKRAADFQLVALTEQEQGLPSPWLQLLMPAGAKFSSELRPFLAQQPQSPDKVKLVFIDHEAVVQSIREADTANFPDLEALWSRLSFNHYLSAYLSKRTFFGPRREQRAFH